MSRSPMSQTTSSRLPSSWAPRAMWVASLPWFSMTAVTSTILYLPLAAALLDRHLVALDDGLGLAGAVGVVERPWPWPSAMAICGEEAGPEELELPVFFADARQRLAGQGVAPVLRDPAADLAVAELGMLEGLPVDEELAAVFLVAVLEQGPLLLVAGVGRIGDRSWGSPGMSFSGFQSSVVTAIGAELLDTTSR